MKYHILKIYDHVMTDPSLLNIEEKILYTHILSWELDNKVCFTSDQTFSELIGKTVQETLIMLKQMERRKRIKLVYAMNGTARMVKTNRIPEPVTEQALQDIFDIG